MVEHFLKTQPDYWDAIWSGDKTFEVRRDDRGFQKGDILILCKLERGKIDSFVGQHGGVTSRPLNAAQIFCKVKYILTGGQLGIEPGHVVMAFKVVSK